ncbi:hypothetical protein QYF36_009377 [Acer negundo]|nr:hypothetical protein QYF36_009377 [Acer negundo]
MGDLYAWLVSFFFLIALLVLVVYQLMCLADLEFDYINPYDSSSRINKVILPEFITEGVLCFFYLITGHWFMSLLCVPYFYYNVRLYMRKQHLVDVTEIFNLLNWEKKQRLFKLAYLIFLLFLSIFWMIWCALEDTVNITSADLFVAPRRSLFEVCAERRILPVSGQRLPPFTNPPPLPSPTSRIARFVKQILYHSRKPDAFSWSCAIRFLSQHGQFKEAFFLYVQQQRLGLYPSSFAFSSALKACAWSVFKMGGLSIHAQRMPERNFASWNALISGYVDSGNIESARSLFDVMSQKNSISWITMIAGYSKWGDIASARELFDQLGEKDLLTFNAMIACYAQNSQPNEALQLFNEMLEADVKFQPDNFTFASVISACSQIGDIRSGSWIETYMEKFGIEMNDHLATALIDLYAKCGDINKAYDLFDGLRKKDLVAYTAMIFGCGINGRAVDAIKLFEEMVDNQIYPNINVHIKKKVSERFKHILQQKSIMTQ